MAQNVYECLFILDSNRYARDPAGVTGTIPTMIEKLGGEVLANRLWNEQKLAYPINGHRKGTYWLTYFRADSSKVAEFNRACQLNDAILRNLVVKVDPRLADVLVSHALGRPTSVAGEGEKAAEEEGSQEQPENREQAEQNPAEGETVQAENS